MPEIPPSDKEVGDSGHTEDHNLIALVLVDHDGRLTAAEDTLATALTTAGGWVIPLNNTDNTFLAYIELPSGDRSGQDDVFGVYRNGIRVAALDGNGYFRAVSHGPEHTPVIIQGHESQSADLERWANNAGDVLARIRYNGELDAPNLKSSTWANVTVSGGFSWMDNPATALRPRYRQFQDEVSLRGTITAPDPDRFSFDSPPPGGALVIGAVPSDFAPPYGHTAIVATSGDINGNHWARINITPSGQIRVSAPGSFDPDTIYLDGIRYSTTP